MIKTWSESFPMSVTKSTLRQIALPYSHVGSRKEFFEAIQLTTPVSDNRVYAYNQPHLYHLAHLDEQYPRCAARQASLPDLLVTKAKQTGATVTYIEDPALLESVGGVAAFLR